MKRFIVTVALPKNPDHDPKNKITGPCPIAPYQTCTDVTGRHHSGLYELADDATPENITEFLNAVGVHVTRIEQVL